MTSEKNEMERIARRLSRAGVASRREAERMIAQGRVKVNGRRIDSPALNVGPDDRIEVDGQPVAAPERPRLWRYHKPAGLVTSARDEKGRPTVFDSLPAELPRVMSVGRLDLNSEGLLLLTNDGALKRRLELPSTGWLRKYRVRVKGAPTPEALAPLERGVTVDGERFQPMVVTIDRQQGANAWLTIGIREGRNREIRRALESLGFMVNRLIRISYGPFQLGDLAPGAVEEIRPKVLREQLGIAIDPSDRAPAPPRPEGEAGQASAPAGKGARRGRGLRGREDGAPQGKAARPASPAPAGKPGPARKPRAPEGVKPRAPEGGAPDAHGRGGGGLPTGAGRRGRR
ncbi:pseudouridine synthase [Oceanicella actignis]|uniref:pseudouridine synthase n=1 Tax=Oceanicella actignis TaxID=1189325 RepID=UPI00147835A6|nr:pseudouridine synthase [Oceanicella actignis]